MATPDLQIVDGADLEQAAAVMNEVWPRPSWRYSAPILGEFLARGAFGMAIGARVGDDLVGFVGGMPFSGWLHGEAFEGVFTSFYTTHPKGSVFGVSTRLLSAVAERARGRGLTKYLTLLEAKVGSQPLIEALHRRAGLDVAELLRIELFLAAGRLHPVDADPRLPRLERFRAADAAGVRELLGVTAPRDGIAHVPDEACLARIFGSREPAWLWREGDRLLACAVLRKRPVRDSVERTNLHVDWVAFAPGVDLLARVRFVNAALRGHGLEDIALVVVPRVGAADHELLRALKMFRGTCTMALYAAELDRQRQKPAPVERGLLEVY
jgi:hypothetical protein